jgi:hypothetical protein
MAAKGNKRRLSRDRAREHERKSEFCFEIGNEARNPPRRGPLPIKYWGVACAQVAIFNGGFYATEVRLRRFGRLGRFPEKSRFLW